MLGDFIDLIKLLAAGGGWVKKLKKEQKEEIAAYLARIAKLLLDAEKKLANREIPTVEGRQLSILFSNANVLAKAFEEDMSGLAQLFKKTIPDVQHQMIVADIIDTDGNPPEGSHRADFKLHYKVTSGKDMAKSTVEAREAMKRLAGDLQGYAFQFDHKVQM